MRAFLIHGWKGNPEEGWFPWLKKELERKGFAVFAPVMPDANHPKADAWVKHLAKVVGTPDKGCYFVGHSLGCITILRYLETLKENQNVGGAVFVAGFSGDLGIKEISNFLTTPVDWNRVKSHCKKFVAIHSDNDSYVPLKYGNILREKLNAELIVKRGAKHFSHGEGFTELPVALDSVLRISNKS